MDTQYLALAHPEHDFLSLPDAGSQGDLEWDRTALPPGWGLVHRAGWVIYTPPEVDLPPTGWKVHVSCRPERAAQVVESVLGICVRHGVTVKTLRSRSLVAASLAKYAPAGAAGKVVTVYPGNDRELAEVAGALAEALRGEPGMRIRGEIPAPDAPVFVRYGAFRAVWLQTAAGEMVPGRREGDGVRTDPRGARAGSPQDGPGARPDLLDRWHAAADEHDSGLILPLADVSVLHRSTAGGVYRGRWTGPVGATGPPDDGVVVAKEARHHCGFDEAGSDAVTRLQHEWAVLRRLSGTGIAPEPLAYLTVGDSDFLIMSLLSGPTASATLAGSHPGVVPGVRGTDDYLGWRDRLLGSLSDGLAEVHRVGVVHGDLHGGNVADLGDRVGLLDWESAALDGVAVAGGVRAVDVPLTPEGDRQAMAHLSDTLLAPLAVLALRRPDLRGPIVEAGQREVDGGGVLTDLDGDHPTPREVADSLVAGLHLLPARAPRDRPFPGDLAQFRAPWASLGLLHGTVGVLLGLAAVAGAGGRSTGGADLGTWVQGWRQRVTDGARAVGTPRGLADGLDGVALAALRLGWDDTASEIADRLIEGAEEDLEPWWGAGDGGRGVVLAELSVGLGRPRLMERAVRHLDRAAAAAGAADSLPGYRPGLLSGLAGVGLSLIRGADLVPERADEYLAAAELAIERELTHTRAVGDGLLTVDRVAVLPYLGHGSAALGLAVQAFGARSGALRPPLAEALGRIETTLRVPVVAQAGILRGRSGLLMALDTLCPGDADVDRHRQRLAWHVVPGRQTCTFADDPQVSLCLGEQNIRCAADLGTGAAGAVAALTPSVALHHLLPLPDPAVSVTRKS